jgi:exopolysaccharide production protein ExoQ
MNPSESLHEENHVPLIEQLFGICSLLMFAGAIIPVIREDRSVLFDANAGDAALRNIFVVIYAITFILVLYRLESFLRAVLRNKVTLVLTFLPIVSVLWSTHPSITLRRSVALLLTAMFGFYIASRYSRRQQLRLLAITLGISLIASILFIMFMPSVGIMTGVLQGSWRGVFLHKNAFGRTIDLGLLTFVLMALGNRGKSWFWWGMALAAIPLIVGSRSAGAIIVCGVMLGLLPFARIMQRSRSLAVPVFMTLLMGVGAVAVVAYADFTTALGVLGKDETLTGRTDLWAFVWDIGRQRPLLGYGYDGFWLGWDGPSAAVWTAFEWLPPHSHNGLIDLWLDLGIIGVGIFVTSFLNAYRTAIADARHDSSWLQLWPFMFLSFLVLANISESTIFQRNDLLWVLYVAATSSIGMQVRTVDSDAPLPDSSAIPSAPRRMMHGQVAARRRPL